MGNSNTAIGYDVLGSNTTGSSNTATGASALYSNVTGSFNTASGTFALNSNISGNNNTANGASALVKNTTGTNNTSSGSNSLFNNTTGSSNTANGENVLYSNTTGSSNTGIGVSSLRSNTTGEYNVASGANALLLNITGEENTASGYAALASNLTGNRNTASGYGALVNNTAGVYNTAIGYFSLISNTTGSNNTAIGYNANVASNNLTNATAIGNGATVTASNAIQLGNSSVTNVKTSGTITAGAITYPNTAGTNGYYLKTDGTGTASWAAVSGLPTSGNTAGDMLYWNGSAWVKVPAGSNDQTLTFNNGAPVWSNNPFANTLVSKTGKIWMDRNLGASRVATSSTDANAYGDFYQWGRGADGHQIRTSTTTTTRSLSDVPGNANFILAELSDWRSTPNNNLWQGVSGTNNPCPAGFRIPTEAEWIAEMNSWSSSYAAGAFASPLKLPVAGARNSIGTIYNVGIGGNYWSSTIKSLYGGFYPIYIWFDATNSSYTDGLFRAYGLSVRCIKD